MTLLATIESELAIKGYVFYKSFIIEWITLWNRWRVAGFSFNWLLVYVNNLFEISLNTRILMFSNLSI